jgi:hypothetical protein
VAWLESPENKLEAKIAGYGCLLDEEGVVLPSGEVSEARRQLPVIRVGRVHQLVPGQQVMSASAMAALDLLKLHKDTAAARTMSIATVDASRAHVLDVTYDSEVRVTLPVDDLAGQLSRFDVVLAESERQMWRLATVDLMVEQNVPVTLRGTAVAPENLVENTPDQSPSKRTPGGRRSLARAR